MKKAVIYARYSPGANQTAQSIEGQLKVCYEYAARNGYQIMEVYKDEKRSGKGAEKRLDFQRMIRDSAKGRWEVLLVYQLDRFARNEYDDAIYREKLERNGVKIVSAMEHFSDDASGQLMRHVLVGMAAYYSRELSDKIKRGRSINAEKYLSIGANPGLGLKVVDRHIVEDKETSHYVLRIFEMYNNGITMREIVEYMNEMGVKTTKGNAFAKNSLQYILRNKRYIGTYTYQGKDTPGVLPRIVPQELFDAVQAKLEINRQSPGRGRAVEDFILSSPSKLFCGHCNTPYTGVSGTSHTGKQHRYYRKKSKKCKINYNIPKLKIEDAVINTVREMLTQGNMELIAREISALCEREQDNPNVKRLRRLIKDNEKEKANLLKSLKVGNASASAANYVFSEIDKLEKEAAELEKQVVVEENQQFGLSEVDIMYFLNHLKHGNIDDIEYRQLLINSMVNSVYLFDGYFTAIFNSSNQPVKVDVSLFDDIKRKSGSYLAQCSPLTEASKHQCLLAFYFFEANHFSRHFTLAIATLSIVLP